MKLYRGVVEDNNHPDKNGMVKVRIFGLHTEKNENSGEKFEFISTAQLPWAEVIHSAEFGLIGGLGLSTVLKQGAWVLVILEDNDQNKPIVIGTISGKNSLGVSAQYTNGTGFCDPLGKIPFNDRTLESDLNRIARVEDLGSTYNEAINGSTFTVHKKINDNQDIITKNDGVSTANVDQTEPLSKSDLGTYPLVSVLETESGHVIEIDDTPNNERLRVYHRAGSYIEFKTDGSIVQKAVGSTSISHFIHEGAVNEHIAKGVKKYIEENLDQIILGGIRESIEMDLFKHVGGFFKITADGNLEIVGDLKVTGNIEATQKGTFGANLTSKAEVADSFGNLSSLRNAYDIHYHIGNLGVPTAAPTTTDPKTRAGDFTWSNIPKGFK